ncbi:MAG: DUF2782 domain-containing protein [Gammaproteobacteria bacterium]|jgi:hypothetical protein
MHPPIGTRPSLAPVLSFAPVLLFGAALATEQPLPTVTDLDLSVDMNRLEPAIEIKEHENRTVEEYAVNGNVYMLRVTPKYGRPYYLADPDGDGEMEWRRNSAGLDVQPPQWALFKW